MTSESAEAVVQAGPGTPPPVEEQVSSLRLILTLGIAGAVAGLLIALVFGVTQPSIQAYKAKMLRLAVSEVLERPERYETFYVVGDALVAELPAGRKEGQAEKVYLGYDAEGLPVGFALVAGEPGFQDIIKLIFGFDPGSGELLGMKVLESKETPGLGDKIEKDEGFIAQFNGARPPLLGVKSSSGGSGSQQEIDMITGATISSRAIVRIINNSLERLQAPLAAHAERFGP